MNELLAWLYKNKELKFITWYCGISHNGIVKPMLNLNLGKPSPANCLRPKTLLAFPLLIGYYFQPIKAIIFAL